MPNIPDIRNRISEIRKKLSEFRNLKSELRLGFTLIELLVVIAIIGTLGSFIFIATNNATKKARDKTRKQDLSTIKTALVAYFADNSKFAPSSSGLYFVSAGGDNWIPDLAPNYIKKLPKDPLSSSTPQPDVSVTMNTSSNYSFFEAQSSANPPDANGLCTQFGPYDPYFFVGQQNIGSTYVSWRGYLAFNTSVIPPNATITSASLELKTTSSYTFNNHFNLRIRYFGGNFNCVGTDWGGNPPTAPQANNDWSTLNWPGYPGQINIPLIYNLSRINKTGFTGLLLTSDREESNNPQNPSTEKASLYGVGNPDTIPKLTITYSPLCGAYQYIYCYEIAQDRNSFVIWAQLENLKDPQALGNSDSLCTKTPPNPIFNYCLESPL